MPPILHASRDLYQLREKLASVISGKKAQLAEQVPLNLLLLLLLTVPRSLAAVASCL